MRKKLRIGYLIVGIIVSFLLLVGAVSFAKEKTITVKYVSFMNEGEPFQQWLLEVIKGYETVRPNVKIDAIWAGRKNLVKVRPMIAVGKPPEIVGGDPELSYRLKNSLYSYNEALEAKAYDQDKKWRDTFIPAPLEQNTFEGKVLAIPQIVYTSGFFYNIKMKEEFGLQVPETWSEFLTVGEKVKQHPGIYPLGLDNMEIDYNSWYFWWLAARIIGAEEVYDTAYNKPGTSFENPGFLEAAQKVRELIDKGYFPPGFEGSIWPSAQMLWGQGKVFMFFCGAWIPGEMLGSVPKDFEMDLFRFPAVEGGKGDPTTIATWSNLWVILKEAKHTEAAVDFVKYVTSLKWQNVMVDKYLQPSALRGTSVPYGLASQPLIIAQAKKTVRQYLGIRFDDPQMWLTVYRSTVDKLFNRKDTPEQFVEELETKKNRYWEKKAKK